jgi:hypothetical protein
VDVMKSECGNKDFGTAVQFLAVDPVTAECMMINAACKGAGTDELLLGTLICGRTNEEMNILKVRKHNHTNSLFKSWNISNTSSFFCVSF